MEFKKVFISVTNGVAEIVFASPNIEVFIIDYDVMEPHETEGLEGELERAEQGVD